METITYSCETKDGSRKRVKATPLTLITEIRKRFKIETGKNIIIQTLDPVREKWYDVEEDEYDTITAKDDILVIIKGSREEETPANEMEMLFGDTQDLGDDLEDTIDLGDDLEDLPNRKRKNRKCMSLQI